MSEVTTYTCDRCGTVATNKKELGMRWVFVATSTTDPADANYGTRWADYAGRKAQWCITCLTIKGLTQPAKPEDTLGTTPPSLEVLIAELIREEVNAAVNERLD